MSGLSAPPAQSWGGALIHTTNYSESVCSLCSLRLPLPLPSAFWSSLLTPELALYLVPRPG